MRRQARYRDDGHRYRNRGVNEDDGGAATVAAYHRQLTQRLDAVDRQLAELRKFRAVAPTPGTKSGGAEVSRQQVVPTAQAGESSTNREREPTNTWTRKKVFGDRLICWGHGKPGHIRRYCNQLLSADKEATTSSGGVAKMNGRRLDTEALISPDIE